MKMIHVLLPGKDAAYSLYAEGNLMASTKLNNQIYLAFDANFPILLYFTFPNHRRLYLCTYDENGNKFPGIKERLRILSQIRGRSFDRFKRSIDFLNKEYQYSVKYMPVSFFWLLSNMCKSGKNDTLNLKLLYDRYKYFMNDKIYV